MPYCHARASRLKRFFGQSRPRPRTRSRPTRGHDDAAHCDDLDTARFQDVDPFWEFVSGPIHAGSFGPGAMDDTFGPVVKVAKDPGGKPNLPPSAGLQFYGHVAIERNTGVLTVRLKHIENRTLHTVGLAPQRA